MQQGAADKENARDPNLKNQRPEKFAGAKAKDKDRGEGKIKTGPAPLYLHGRQELQLDSESESGYATIALVQPRPQLLFD